MTQQGFIELKLFLCIYDTGGDQGLLNSYFSDWAHGDINKHLPFLYNVTSAAFYSYIPALKQYVYFFVPVIPRNVLYLFQGQHFRFQLRPKFKNYPFHRRR